VDGEPQLRALRPSNCLRHAGLRRACKNVDFAFGTASVPLRYEGVGKEIVHVLKYRGHTAVVERLAAPVLAEAVDDRRGFEAVVPVPLHRARLRRRDFNQAALLVRGLAGRINTPVSDTLQVVRSTRDQVELSAAERRRNVAGAFSAGARVRGGLFLVDDVFTTGAAEVHAVTLCRTC
jgi:competence protein ComFC